MGENSRNEWCEWSRPIDSNKKVTTSKTTSEGLLIGEDANGYDVNMSVILYPHRMATLQATLDGWSSVAD